MKILLFDPLHKRFDSGWQVVVIVKGLSDRVGTEDKMAQNILRKFRSHKTLRS